MGLTTTIAELMLEKGRAQAAGKLGAGQAYGAALQNFGQTLGGAISSLPAQAAFQQELEERKKDAADRQRVRDAHSAFSDALGKFTVDQDGVQVYDIQGIGKDMASKGYAAEFVPAAEHLDNINKMTLGFQQARMGLVRANAQALLAMSDPPVALVNHVLDQLEANQVASQGTVQTYRQFISEHPDRVKDLLKTIAGPGKLTSGAPGSMMRDESGQVIPGSQVPFTPNQQNAVVNGQVVDLATGKPIGAAVPKQSVPMDPEEVNLKKAQVKEIEARLAGNIPMSAKDRAELVMQRNRLSADIQHWNVQDAAANPLAAVTGGGPQISVPGITGQPGGGQAPPAAPPTAQPAPTATGAPPPQAGPQGAAPQPMTTQQAIASNVHGDDFLATLPPATATQVKLYASGRQPFPTGFALRSPYFQSMLNLVGQYDPSFDAINYNARSRTRQDFTSGKSAKTINALNTVAQHLDRLSTSAEELNNSWSPAYNSVANFLSRQSGSKVVTNFETDKKAVVDELTRAWRESGGSEGDIKSWSQVLDAANSPQQLHGAIAEMGQLLEGKLSALQNQFEQGMGHSADIPIVTPQARSTLDRLEGKASGIPESVRDALKGQPKGHRYTLSDGSSWVIDGNGVIRPGS